jgi:hypothetical protein
MRNKPIGIELDRLNKGEVVKKKKKKKQEKTAKETEEDRWAEQMKKGGLVMRTVAVENSKAADEEEDEEDEDEDGEEGKDKAGAPRLLKQNNFQGETGTVDVDKHMMAYIEEEMQKRRQGGDNTSLPNELNLKTAILNPQDELYSIAEKYRKIQQSAQEALDEAKRNVNAGHKQRDRGAQGEEEEKEEGDTSISQAMLTGVPEIELGIDHRMRNIQETERARKAMLEAQKLNHDVKDENEGDFASARCEFVCRFVASYIF